MITLKNVATILKDWLTNLLNKTLKSINELDRPTMLVVFSLIGIGLVQVYSSSYIFATESYGDGLYFFRKQLVFGLIALITLVFSAVIPWKWVKASSYSLWFFTVFGIILTFVPGIGKSAGGAARWIQLPLGFRFEPSELMKVSIAFVLAFMMAKKEDFFTGLRWLVPLLIVGLPSVVLLKQPDFGSFVICAFVILALLFFHGLNWRYIFGAVIMFIPTFYFLVMKVPYRRARVISFLDPWSDPANGGFQLIQSMLSFHSGGLTGVGLGQSQGKLFFLPEAHTDFTFSILAEEVGFVGFVFVMFLFGFLVLRGLQISIRLKDVYARLLTLGLVVGFALKVVINAGVVTGLLPTKGLALPFLSYGGSSLIMSALTFGIILNVQRTFAPNPVSSSRESKNVKGWKKKDSRYQHFEVSP